MECRVHLSSVGDISFPKSPTVLEVAQKAFPQKAAQVVGALVNDDKNPVDLRTSLSQGDRVELVFIPSGPALEVIRHSAAHVMAQAVQELWPSVKVGIGPVTENGFYYDFDTPRPFEPGDLQKIEKKMKQILKRKLPVTKQVWDKPKALSFFKNTKDEPYKIKIIENLNPGEAISVYQQGEWVDLCRGPHVANLRQIGAIKVLHQSGAYWQGDESQNQMQRIYGTAFHSEADLKNHLQLLEEAQASDHRKVGKEMGLFYFSDLSPGSPFFTGSGTVIYNELQSFLRTLYRKYKYEEVISPQLFNEDLFLKSGHKNHFLDNMYPVQVTKTPSPGPPSDPTNKPSPHTSRMKEFFLKPMNCPGHCLLYSSQKHSYRDLPVRMADFGRLHRRERKGVLHGITRVNSMCQDDAHIFCTLPQLPREIEGFLTMLKEVYHTLGLTEYKIALSTRPLSFMGEKQTWDQAEEALSSVLKKQNIPFHIQKGEGAFYGPKLDVMLVDRMKRTWQMGTLQCDFNMPKAFHLKYTDSQNKDQTPVLLHRALLGTLERFIGVYMEHTGGHFPLWLAPVQVLIVNISKDQEHYATQIKKTLQDRGIRVRTDLRGEKLGYKIRQARRLRIPLTGVVGGREQQTHSLSLRTPDGSQLSIKTADFVEKATRAIQSKALNVTSLLRQDL